jgi:nitrogen regulatory protein P-II 1
MRKIEAYIRPEKLSGVVEALRRIQVNGFTVCNVQGRGAQKDSTGVYRGHVYSINLHPKVKLEIVVSDEFVQETVHTIIQTAQTGQAGDGKIFVMPVYEAYNIRTGAIDETIDELNRKADQG